MRLPCGFHLVINCVAQSGEKVECGMIYCSGVILKYCVSFELQ